MEDNKTNSLNNSDSLEKEEIFFTSDDADVNQEAQEYSTATNEMEAIFDELRSESVVYDNEVDVSGHEADESVFSAEDDREDTAEIGSTNEDPSVEEEFFAEDGLDFDLDSDDTNKDNAQIEGELQIENSKGKRKQKPESYKERYGKKQEQ